MSDTNNNYRVEFLFSLDNSIDYYKDFKEVRRHIRLINSIIEKVKKYGNSVVYYTFQPHAEITWQAAEGDNQANLLKQIKRFLKKNDIDDCKVTTPKIAHIGEWYAKSDAESRWGEGKYAKMSELALHILNNIDLVEGGNGVENHIWRAMHILYNDLGLTFKDEARFCLKVATNYYMCKIFRRKVGRWIVKNIFRIDY